MGGLSAGLAWPCPPAGFGMRARLLQAGGPSVAWRMCRFAAWSAGAVYSRARAVRAARSDPEDPESGARTMRSLAIVDRLPWPGSLLASGQAAGSCGCFLQAFEFTRASWYRQSFVREA